MALENTPWFIGGGAEHSADIARILANAATSGATGIARPADLRVAAQAVPNGTVRVLPGVATIASTFAGAVGQSYIARNISQTNVTILPTGSGSGRSDLIVLTITDPQYVGSAPADPNAFDYTRLEVVSGVPNTQRDLTGLNLGKPGIALARIDIPASTGTITSGMIKDLRKLAVQRKERNLSTLYPTGYVHDGTAHSAGGVYSSWPIRTTERPQIFIPEWCTQIQAVINVSGAYYKKNTSVDSVLGVRTGFGTEGSQNGIVIAENTGRLHFTVIGTHAVEAARRGTLQYFNIQAQQTRGNGTFSADYQTSLAVDIEFSEVPE